MKKYSLETNKFKRMFTGSAKKNEDKLDFN